MSKLQAGDRVKHNFSSDRGVIEATRRDPQGYNYLVRWDYPDNGRNVRDWYRSEVMSKYEKKVIATYALVFLIVMLVGTYAVIYMNTYNACQEFRSSNLNDVPAKCLKEYLR